MWFYCVRIPKVHVFADSFLGEFFWRLLINATGLQLCWCCRCLIDSHDLSQKIPYRGICPFSGVLYGYWCSTPTLFLAIKSNLKYIMSSHLCWLNQKKPYIYLSIHRMFHEKKYTNLPFPKSVTFFPNITTQISPLCQVDGMGLTFICAPGKIEKITGKPRNDVKPEFDYSSTSRHLPPKIPSQKHLWFHRLVLTHWPSKLKLPHSTFNWHKVWGPWLSN